MAYTIFPLFGFDHDAEGKPRCRCGDDTCTRWGKHPRYPYSKLEPGQQVFGDAGHGLLTGYKSGVFVVDTDGPEADRRFREMGELPETYTVKTPSGGRHYYFAWPGFAVRTSQSELGEKIDIRGDVNGYVVVPGSPHVSGRSYTGENQTPPAHAPAWLLEWAGLRGSLKADSASDVPVFAVDVATDVGIARVALGRKACEEMPPSITGENGSLALWNLALTLVRKYELPIDTCVSLILDVFNPRCSPPWSPREIIHKLEDARDKSDLLPGLPLDVARFKKAWREHFRMKNAPQRKQRNPAHKPNTNVGDVANSKGSKLPFANVCSILRTHPDWAGVLQHDVFRDRVFAVDPPIRMDAQVDGYSDKDTDRIVAWFNLAGGMKAEDGTTPVEGYTLAPETAFRAAMLVASENAYHPVREYLDALLAEDGSFLDTAADHIFGTTDALDRVFVKRFLVAAVRRVMNPGTKVDTMLVLAGPQGVGKSTFVRALFGADWTAEDIPELSSKDAVVALVGKWGVEVAELDKVMRTDPETTKAFLSRCIDTYRPPYGRSAIDRRRENVFVGTTNRDDILRDATGSRRFWIVKADRVDLTWLKENRDALWSAALTLVEQGEPHWLTEEEDALRAERAKQWEERDPWHEKIADYLVGKTSVTAEDVFRAVGGTSEHFDRKALLRVTDTLRRIGCEKVIEGQGRRKVRKWGVPSDLAALAKVDPMDPKGSEASDPRFSFGLKQL